MTLWLLNKVSKESWVEVIVHVLIEKGIEKYESAKESHEDPVFLKLIWIQF